MGFFDLFDCGHCHGTGMCLYPCTPCGRCGYSGMEARMHKGCKGSGRLSGQGTPRSAGKNDWDPGRTRSAPGASRGARRTRSYGNSRFARKHPAVAWTWRKAGKPATAWAGRKAWTGTKFTARWAGKGVASGARLAGRGAAAAGRGLFGLIGSWI
jgi:hypothetical protein